MENGDSAAGPEKAPKKAGGLEKLIVGLACIAILWNFGILQMIFDGASSLIGSVPQSGTTDSNCRFNILNPSTDSVLDSSSDKLTASFTNSLDEAVTVEAVTVKNPNNKACTVTTKLPFEAPPKSRIKLTATNCPAAGLNPGQMAKIYISIAGKAKKSALMTDSLTRSPITMFKDKDANSTQRIEQLKAKARSSPGANEMVALTSCGTIISQVT